MISQKRGLIYLVLSLLVLVLTLSSVTADVSGCYVYSDASEDLYCIGGILDTEARADCEENPGCSLNQHFIPGSDCSEFEVCREITCSTDCQTHALGICQALDGAEVLDEDYALWCSPGCCKIADLFCQFGLIKSQCQTRAAQFGINNPLFNNKIGMDAAACQTSICQRENLEPAELTVSVVNEAGEPLPGITVELTGIKVLSGLTNKVGEVVFSGVSPGSYLVRATKTSYLAASIMVSLAPLEEAQTELILIEAVGNANVDITVVMSDGASPEGATISWGGVVEGRTQIVGDDGQIRVDGIPAGRYTFTASKIGYAPHEKPLIIQAGENNALFRLEPAALQGVRGRVFLDHNANGDFDQFIDEAVYGAQIRIDGLFRGFSQFPDGDYDFEVLETGEHTISAAYLDYQLEAGSEDGIFEIIAERELNKDLPLTKYVGECTNADTEKPVEIFSVIPVPGKNELRLDWIKPCPEVLGYKIVRFHNGERDGTEFFPSAVLNFILDNEVEWGEEYSYEITALYDNGRTAGPTSSQTINVGDIRCRDRFNEEGEYETFCLPGTREERQQVWMCNSLNQISSALSCPGEAEGALFFCAQISQGNADCKDAGACSSSDPFSYSEPFGLYYSRSQCYGTDEPEEFQAQNFCYYDHTDTIVDQCQKCEVVIDCFAYQSKDACEINSCLSEKCNWVPGAANVEPIIDYKNILHGALPLEVTPETGGGYCVQEDYEPNTYCGLCNRESSLFDNYYCTAEVCSSLGSCFSDISFAKCNACREQPTPEANCYEYNTKLECVGEQQVLKDTSGNIIPSADQCSWNRCRWQGEDNAFSSGSCVKDGDADEVDDCSDGFRGGEVVRCHLDNSPPKTMIRSQGIPMISTAHTNITFESDDSIIDQLSSQENPLGVLGYCIENAEEGALETCLIIGGEDPFVEVSYPGRISVEAISVDILNSGFLNDQIDRKTYRLKYYSKDKYYNQEDVQESLIYVDNVAPEFTIKTKAETVADKTTLTAYLNGLREPADCTFSLKRVLPLGDSQQVSVDWQQRDKSAVFNNLDGIRYTLNVTCIDLQDNEFPAMEELVFDLEQDIDIIRPVLRGTIAETAVTFAVQTDIGASCALYLTENNQKLADFQTDEEGKNHQTAPVSGFVEREYAATHKVVCQELLNTSDLHEDYFHFLIDFTPPETQIILREGAREARPANYGWEEFFIESAQVEFECQAEGFECNKINYCLGDGCELINNPNYQEYQASFELEESTKICYFATDLAENPVYQPLCGEVLVVGYGITLERPPLHFYADEMWGISNTPAFDSQFFTRVPTMECRFDFAPNFDYAALPRHKIVQPNANNRYLFAEFPESVFAEFSPGGSVKEVYVRCMNTAGKVGPEQKMLLEYDPSSPEITSAFADPSTVLEGITTTLFASTDDKTLCRYGDVSAYAGDLEIETISSYETMEFSFPGEAEKILLENHQEVFTITEVNDDGKKDYLFNVQCKNGAENVSQVDVIEFSVDYTELGYILPSSLQPKGYLPRTAVSLSLQTSKNAFCEYDYNGSYISFTSGGGSQFHESALNDLEEMAYKIPVRCRMGGHLAYAVIEFTIDRSAPVISEVNDGNFSCGAQDLAVMVYFAEEEIENYTYEVYDKGVVSSFVIPGGENQSSQQSSQQSSRGSSLNVKIIEGTATNDLPIKIPAESLEESHMYTVKVRADDAAGNAGGFKESDGFIVVSENHSTCLNDNSPPKVSFLANRSCLGASVELACEDQTGCRNFLYGVSDSAESCEADRTYLGQRIALDGTSWVCYSVADNKGQNISGMNQITTADKDGDDVADSCDLCDTGAGKISGMNGCASGDVLDSRDTDRDGLPDEWEKIYNSFGCELDFESPDSNSNRISDALEDYDEDSFSNFEEFRAESDPCVANKNLPGMIEDVSPPSDILPSISAEANTLAWVLLIIGFLMFMGGIGYLVYYYRFAKQERSVREFSSASSAKAGPVERASSGILSGWQNKLAKLRRERAQKSKQRERISLFGAFGKDSSSIPKVDQAVRKGEPHLPSIRKLAEHYTSHKDEIKPGLRPEEKGIFAKLENLAKKTEGKKVEDVVSRKEAKDIFSKLKEVSEKRKKK